MSAQLQSWKCHQTHNCPNSFCSITSISCPPANWALWWMRFHHALVTRLNAFWAAERRRNLTSVYGILSVFSSSIRPRDQDPQIVVAFKMQTLRWHFQMWRTPADGGNLPSAAMWARNPGRAQTSVWKRSCWNLLLMLISRDLVSSGICKKQINFIPSQKRTGVLYWNLPRPRRKFASFFCERNAIFWCKVAVWVSSHYVTH